jgi:hypothetical protein
LHQRIGQVACVFRCGRASEGLPCDPTLRRPSLPPKKAAAAAASAAAEAQAAADAAAAAAVAFGADGMASDLVVNDLDGRPEASSPKDEVRAFMHAPHAQP